MTSASYTLVIDNSPASGAIMEAVSQIEIDESARMADMVRLSLGMQVNQSVSGWDIVDDEVFRRLTPLRVQVAVNAGPPETVVEALVIETNATFSSQPGASTFEVVAMDPTVEMNFEEKVRDWPNMSDSDIASSIFGEYNLTSQVDGTQPSRSEQDMTVIQRMTDIQFLQHLAQRNGYLCYVEPNPISGAMEGHFHPPRLDETPQGELSVHMGEASNVETFRARYEMIRPAAADATGLDVDTQEDQSGGAESASLTLLGSSPTLNGGARRLRPVGLGLMQSGELQTYAQGIADQTAMAIIAQGELSVLSYGGLLRAKRPVLVRGAGRQFSGTYFVDTVHTVLTQNGITQSFTLRRNALGGESFAA